MINLENSFWWLTGDLNSRPWLKSSALPAELVNHIMASEVGFKPTGWQSQSLLPYHLATPKCVAEKKGFEPSPEYYFS